jgi:two-component system, OmpR family, phosphate regulon sensor histidine kinase PhoR
MTFRLHSRLVFWNLVVIALMSAILGYFLNYSLRNDIDREIEDELKGETALAVAYIDLMPQQVPNDSIADRIGTMLNRRVTLIAFDGRVLGDSEVDQAALPSVENHIARPEFQEAMHNGTGSAVRWSATVMTDFIYVARRTDSYVVRIATPLSSVQGMISDMRTQLLLAVTVAVGLTLLFAYLVHGLISVPLRNIANGARKLAAGNLQQRLPISGDEEIAALGNSLNTMAENLNARMQELTDGKQRLEKIVAAMTEGVLVLDREGRITLTNASIQSILATERNLVGMTLLEVSRRPELEKAARNVLAGGSTEKVELTTSTGRVLEANIAPVSNTSGSTDSAVVVFHDLTNIKRTERMRRDFVANVSHEFKTPLTSIRGFAETLLTGALADRKIATDFVRTIERNAQHLEALVSDLLTLARIESELPATKERISIKSIIDEQVSARQSVLAERNIRIVNECAVDGVLADRARLSTAISNLIDNAILYNKPGGEVRITGAKENDTFRLDITDTGEGIAPEELSRIFERFYRVDKARTRVTGGTGLGLSIVKHAIESQGGTIQVTSRLGTGSTFTIRLPLQLS